MGRFVQSGAVCHGRTSYRAVQMSRRWCTRRSPWRDWRSRP